MKLSDLAGLVGGLACFDLPLVVQAFPDRRSAIRLQLTRWVKQGKVIHLRRGMYTLPDHARKVRLDAAVLAQHLCRPSYLSGLWALGFHDMIPERVVVHTSATTRLPAGFTNAFGVYE
jgi:predicted transcriptional regulator of viral defense system